MARVLDGDLVQVVRFPTPFAAEPSVTCSAVDSDGHPGPASLRSVVEVLNVGREGFTFRLSNNRVKAVYWMAIAKVDQHPPGFSALGEAI